MLKVASEADKAAKGGDSAAALAALTNYREAVDALDPAGEAMAALPAQNRDKVMEKRAQAMKRIAKLEALAEPAPEMAAPPAAVMRDYTVDYTPSQREPAPAEEAPAPEDAPDPGGDLKSGLAKIKAASEADKAVKDGDDSRIAEALANYRQAVELLDPASDAVAALPEPSRAKIEEKRGLALRRIAKLEQLADAAAAPEADPLPEAVVPPEAVAPPEAARDYSVEYRPAREEARAPMPTVAFDDSSESEEEEQRAAPPDTNGHRSSRAGPDTWASRAQSMGRASAHPRRAASPAQVPGEDERAEVTRLTRSQVGRWTTVDKQAMRDRRRLHSATPPGRKEEAEFGPNPGLVAWLQELHLEAFVEPLFETLGVSTLEDVKELEAEDLESIGVKPIQRKRLLRAAGTITDSSHLGLDFLTVRTKTNGVRAGNVEAPARAEDEEVSRSAHAVRVGRRLDDTPNLQPDLDGSVAVEWADAIVTGGAGGPLAGRGVQRNQIGVVDRLFDEVKPLLVRRHIDEFARQQPVQTPAQPSYTMAAHLGLHSAVGRQSPPPLPLGLHPSAQGAVAPELWLSPAPAPVPTHAPAPAPAPAPSPAAAPTPTQPASAAARMTIGPGVHGNAKSEAAQRVAAASLSRSALATSMATSEAHSSPASSRSTSSAGSPGSIRVDYDRFAAHFSPSPAPEPAPSGAARALPTGSGGAGALERLLALGGS